MAEVTKKVRKTIEVVSDILCDCCRKSCKDETGELQYMELTAYWGYGSKKDLTKWTAKVCERCVDKKLIKIIKFDIKNLNLA